MEGARRASSFSATRQVLVDLRRTPAVLSAILAVAILLLYLPVLHHQFLDFDDTRYVNKNPHVNSGLSVDNVVWAFNDIDTFYWHPVTWISHMADCQLFGINSGTHHLTNVALQIANTLLLFFLLRSATGATWRSFMVAALFALHPLNLETVAWLAERKSLLSAFFSFLTFAAYGWYVRRPHWTRYLLVVAALALALMSKPMAVTVPVLLLLFDFWPLRRCDDLPLTRRLRALIPDKLPLLVLAVASSAVTAIGHRHAMASLSAVPLTSRLQNALLAYASYIYKIFWPAKLAAFYPLPTHTLAKMVAAALVLLCITVFVLYFRSLGYPIVGWCLFLLTLLPVSGIVQIGGVAMADRFAYMPAIGIFVIVIWGCCDLLERMRIQPLVPALTFAALLIVLAATSRYYLQFWHDGVSLFTRVRTVEDHEDPMVEEFLGDALANAGRPDEAFVRFRESCNLSPISDLCHYNMAEYLFSRNQLGEAVEQYQLAARFTSKQDMALSAYINAADALRSMGDYQASEMMLSRALQIDPANVSVRNLLQQVKH